ncbi:hypothetical protein ACFP7A_05420 [Sporolactobacillus kofuensis]|uniref:Uncharacterized protein n=1 Tax=Sporolactobacillus kofuensis TaxID=269672 RepID=A0ABW1WBS2_9BACL|nr:hypothetical protein [Sporolactobacillus kofuensis]MCO7175212.1 hypothetical protein [Sporolactobacillus kofuensis]
MTGCSKRLPDRPRQVSNEVQLMKDKDRAFAPFANGECMFIREATKQSERIRPAVLFYQFERFNDA